MKILISGSGGFIGSALSKHLAAEGHDLFRLVRGKRGLTQATRSGDVSVPAFRDIPWSPDGPALEFPSGFQTDAVIHLAGENIAGGLWTKARKQRILDSRVKGTTILSEALARLEPRPKVLLSASAVGYYGYDTPGDCNESTESGPGFLAEVCRQWEGTTSAAREAGIRVVHLRLGVILSPEGGMLARVLPVFRLGIGGRLGSGNQHMSWISLTDAVKAVAFLLARDDLSGPVNIVAPNPVTDAEFTLTLAATLHRPAWFPVPAPMLRLIGGELARELLLASQRALPGRLLESGFAFSAPTLQGALDSMLSRTGACLTP